MGFAKPLSKGFQGQSCETTQGWREKHAPLVCAGMCVSQTTSKSLGQCWKQSFSPADNPSWSPTTSLLEGFPALLSDGSCHTDGMSRNPSKAQASLGSLLETCEIGEVILPPLFMDRDPDSLEGGVTCFRPWHLSAGDCAVTSSWAMARQVWVKLAGCYWQWEYGVAGASSCSATVSAGFCSLCGAQLCSLRG